MNNLLKGISAGSLVYGLGVGFAAKPYEPKNVSDAKNQANKANLARNLGRDLSLSFIDDAATIALSLVGRRLFPEYRFLANFIRDSTIVLGSGAAGAITSHDIQNFFQARRYLSDRGIDPDSLQQASKSFTSDKRYAKIDGFSKNGTAAQRRKDWAGISSPSSQGLFYRIFNNPYTQFLNNIVTSPDPDNNSDPRTKALTYGYLGGLVGSLLGGRWRGLSGAAIGGIAGATFAGTIGIHQAHSPDLYKNFQATTSLVETAGLPILATAGIYGLTRLPKIGAVLAKGLEKGNMGLSRMGLALESMTNRGLNKTEAWASTIEQKSLSKKLNLADRLVSPVIGAMDYTLGLTKSTAVPFLKHSTPYTKEGGMKPVWEQAAGLGTITTWLPVHTLIAAKAVGIYQDHQKARSKRLANKTNLATSSMPSNRRRS